MSQWLSGDSLSPTMLNLRATSASSTTGFSTNTLSAESGGVITTSQISTTTLGASLVSAQNVVAYSTISTPSLSAGVFTQTLASSTSLYAVQVASGSAILPTYAFNSEASLGFYRSAASMIASSYGTVALLGVAASQVLAATNILISSATTSASGATAKMPNQGQISFSILSNTTNGAELCYRSGNTVYRWPSSLVG